tara:strand:+ start:12326 stop:12760 length:435 start_codon:yes stop_codon:yes gene_type:complete
MTTELARRNSIDALEAAMMALPDQIVIADMDVRHHITDSGLYAREMIIPAGTIITGKIKKHEHISVISAGFVTEVTDAGLQRIKAPYTMISKPGTKRVVWAHETTVWTTIHASEETDLDKLESELIAASYDDMPALIQQLELEV